MTPGIHHSTGALAASVEAGSLERIRAAAAALVEAVDDYQRGQTVTREADYVPFFRLCLEEQVAVDFTYEKPGAPADLRTVSPYEFMTARNGAVSLLGYDHDRGALRSFRLDRISLPGPARAASFIEPQS